MRHNVDIAVASGTFSTLEVEKDELAAGGYRFRLQSRASATCRPLRSAP
jgi:hypothetical protein